MASSRSATLEWLDELLAALVIASLPEPPLMSSLGSGVAVREKPVLDTSDSRRSAFIGSAIIVLLVAAAFLTVMGLDGLWVLASAPLAVVVVAGSAALHVGRFQGSITPWSHFLALTLTAAATGTAVSSYVRESGPLVALMALPGWLNLVIGPKAALTWAAGLTILTLAIVAEFHPLSATRAAGPVLFMGLVLGASVTIERSWRRGLPERRLKRVSRRDTRDFLRNLGHEVSAPLATIAGFAEALRAGMFAPLSPAQEQTVSEIERIASTHLRLQRRLIALRRIETGSGLGAWVPILPDDELRRVFVLLEQEGAYPEVRAELHGACQRPIEANAANAREMLASFAEGAFALATKGAHLIFSLEQHDSQTVLSTEFDAPIGTAERLSAAMQSSSATIRSRDKRVWNLALARAIAELHGGLVDATELTEPARVRLRLSIPGKPAPIRRSEVR